MRIVIDLQGLQAEFSSATNEPLGFVTALANEAGVHELFVVLSGHYEASILPIRRALAAVVRPENIRVWFGLDGANTADAGLLRTNCNRLIHEAFLANLQPDLLVLSDLSVDVQSLGRLPDGPRAFKLALICGHLKTADRQAARNIAGHFDLFLALEGQEVGDLLDRDTSANRIIRFAQKASANSQLELSTQGVFQQWLEDSAAGAAPSIDLQRLEQQRPTLAFVSPLPPQRSGIADYSAELIPYLARYYDIDVVVDQAEVTNDWIHEHCRIQSMSEFENSGQRYDRVLYHFGNNPMHAKMFELLERHPGVVVLHDFFLGHLQWDREHHSVSKSSFWSELYLSHGYMGVKERTCEGDASVVFRYPCSFVAFQRARGVIVHSDYSLQLARQWYERADGVSVIPLMRHPAKTIDRAKARKKLGFTKDDFVVCSFGFLGETKLNHRLLDAWEASSLLSGDAQCKLIFVGENGDSPYGHELAKRIQKLSKTVIVKISGWTDTDTYRMYLAAADAAVQLRTLSRGETSAAVLDCMNYALATVINANGSMADIPSEVAQKMPDDFTNSELVVALESLRSSPAERYALGQRAQDFIKTVHDPVQCAEGYAQSIESFYRVLAPVDLVRALAKEFTADKDEQLLIELAKVLANSFPSIRPARTLFLDVSGLARSDLKTGIQRVVRALTLALIDAPPVGYRIEPVYITDAHGEWHFRYARDYTQSLLNSVRGLTCDERVDLRSGDILLGLDFVCDLVTAIDRAGVYRELMNRGVKVSFVVYDLLPIHFGDFFPPSSKASHADWLRVVTRADSAICISNAVATELSEWVAENAPDRAQALDVQWFHLGADLETSSPSAGMPDNAPRLLEQLVSAPCFLMVGTVEPRKGHGQVLDAFDLLWSEGCNLNLVIVGKEGWMVEALAARFRQHPELGKRLHWLEGVSDEYLSKIYANSSCLLAASLGEGFGLPLIEAAQHKLPILARDLPVFREVAGEHAFYFSGTTARNLATSIREWVTLYQLGRQPTSEQMPWLTWKESAEQMKLILLE